MKSSIRIAILTVSDRSSRGDRADLSGPALVEYTQRLGWELVHSAIVPDELDSITKILKKWCKTRSIDLILTTGGTGFAPRDVTPEATQAVIERATPGLVEVMRAESMKASPHAILSRAVAGICDRTLIINLPGSPRAAVENLAIVAGVIPHAVELLQENPDAEAHHQVVLPPNS